MSDAQKKIRVVLVEDNNEIRRATQLYLERHGVDVISTESPLGVGALLLRHQPMVVVLDVMMPALTGDSLAKMIRQRSTHPPILLYSAMAEEELYKF